MKEKTIIVGHAGTGLATAFQEVINKGVTVVEHVQDLSKPEPMLITAQHFITTPQLPMTRRERRAAERKAKKKN
jgi:hypothetical protein